ncbi:PilN domain-containing protein [Zophobihabitans entericus]|uniref:Type II secretion system protein L n=1 Tax=Zophobihabitans entericus TaxID=1635327 RepID=A0A6G9I9Q0_9GAMM|nr:PilN domain-containing protein [Zophobihabitans entericus]QIQ20946.1 hypothetical protein IPMB12_04170 [Zophobihabitans entericus]
MVQFWPKGRIKYQIGIEVQAQQITFAVASYQSQQLIKVEQHHLYTDKTLIQYGAIDSNESLIHLLAQIKRQVPNLACCYIALPEEQFLQQSFKLPQVKLSEYDTERFIQAALPQLFLMPAEELAIDYPVNQTEFTITAAKKEQIEQWQTVFKRAGLALSGIDIVIPETSYEQAYLLATSVPKVNLLPWREQCRKRKVRQLYISITCCALLCILGLLFTYQYYSGIRQILTEQVRLQIAENDNSQQFLVALKQLNQKVTAQYQLRVKNQQGMMIIDSLSKYLDLIQMVIPNEIWLDELIFDTKNLELFGQSFTYPAIVEFIQKLDESSYVRQAMLQRIHYQQAFWRFQTELTLTEYLTHE